MDLDTAINHSRMLKSELDVISYYGTVLPLSRKLLANEISGLDRKISSQYMMRSIADVSQIKIPVENPLLMFEVSIDFELSGISSLLDFKWRLASELIGIINIRPRPLPLTFQFVLRVIELLNEEIKAHQENEISSSRATPASKARRMPQRRSGAWMEFVDICIKDAIDLVLMKDPEGGYPSQVLAYLEENPSIQVDDNVRSLVRKRYFEATFPLKSKQATKVQGKFSRI